MTATLSPAPRAADPAAGRRPRLVLWTAVAGLVAAGGLHVLAAGDHIGAGDLAVGFFLVAAAAQLGTAALLGIAAVTGLRPNPVVLAATLAGTVALLGLYLVAHTTGVLDAFAVPHAAGAEHAAGHGGGTTHLPQVDPVTGVDLSAGMSQVTDGPVDMGGTVASDATEHSPGTTGTATVAAELLTVPAVTALLPAGWRRRATDALFAAGALAWALWITGVLR